MTHHCHNLIIRLQLCLLFAVVGPTTAAFAAVGNNNNFLPFVSSSKLRLVGASQDANTSNKDDPTASATTALPLSSATDCDHQELLSLPADFPRRETVLVALQAVRKAARVIQPLQPPSATSSSGSNSNHATATGAGISNTSTSIPSILQKSDYSPVTVADFAAQAVVLHHLHQHFPNDSFIAEESSQTLQQRQQDAALIAKQVWQVSQLESLDVVLQSIDLGKQYERQQEQNKADNKRQHHRVWCLDPIDGTKGFLRGEQYCIALALLENGVPVVGILACPNLPQEGTGNSSFSSSPSQREQNQKLGCIFVASQGGGCYQLPFDDDDSTCSVVRKLHVTPTTADDNPRRPGRFCLGVETSFGDAAGYTMPMVRMIHGCDYNNDNNISDRRLLEDTAILRMDSQAKFGVIARGDAEYYVRLPPAWYQEWIWDVAAGYVVLTEAGGVLTDTAGRAIDFSQGAKLSMDVQGILGSNGGRFHSALVQAYQIVKEEKQNDGEG